MTSVASLPPPFGPSFVTPSSVQVSLTVQSPGIAPDGRCAIVNRARQGVSLRPKTPSQ